MSVYFFKSGKVREETVLHEVKIEIGLEDNCDRFTIERNVTNYTQWTETGLI